MIHTFIVAPSAESAAVRAAEAEVPDGQWQHVRAPGDLKGASGVLLFAADWRELFPPAGDGLGINEGPGALLAAAHANPDLTVELAA